MALLNGGAKEMERPDRRRYTRVEWALPVELTLPTEKLKGNGPLSSICGTLTQDIGIGGISCDAVIENHELAREISSKKKRLNLDIELIEKNTDIRTKADVIWMYNLKGLSAKTKYRLGLGFVEMKKKESRLLMSCLEEMISLKRERSIRERQKIKKVLAQIAKIDVDSFSEETKIRQELKVDSLMAMETLAVLETIYDIEIDVDRVVDVVTVGDMMRLIEGYLEPKSSIR